MQNYGLYDFHILFSTSLGTLTIWFYQLNIYGLEKWCRHLKLDENESSLPNIWKKYIKKAIKFNPTIAASIFWQVDTKLLMLHYYWSSSSSSFKKDPYKRIGLEFINKYSDDLNNVRPEIQYRLEKLIPSFY